MPDTNALFAAAKAEPVQSGHHQPAHGFAESWLIVLSPGPITYPPIKRIVHSEPAHFGIAGRLSPGARSFAAVLSIFHVYSFFHVAFTINCYTLFK